MHKTSTTTYSEAIDRLREWDSVLNESSWTPIEQLLETITNVGILVTYITDTTTDSMFTDEEIKLMFQVTKKAESVSHDILLSQQEGDSYE